MIERYYGQGRKESTLVELAVENSKFYGTAFLHSLEGERLRSAWLERLFLLDRELDAAFPAPVPCYACGKT